MVDSSIIKLRLWVEAFKECNNDIHVVDVADEIAAAFGRMLSGPFPKIGEDGKLLREELLAQFNNVGLGELIARFIVTEANIRTILWSEKTKVSFDNLKEAKKFLKAGILIKMNMTPNYSDAEDFIWGMINETIFWNYLEDVSSVITEIIPKTAVLIG